MKRIACCLVAASLLFSWAVHAQTPNVPLSMLPNALLGLTSSSDSSPSTDVATGQGAAAPAWQSGQPSISGLQSPMITGGTPLPGTGQIQPPLPNIGAQAYIPAQRLGDYDANQKSEVFGTQLFTGAFARSAPSTFNPDYAVAIGDGVRVRIWGGFDFDSVLTVDSQGMIFLPHCGPMRVAGIHNRDLQAAVTGALRKVFSSNVSIYASLASAQPVRVLVSGFVRHPGMYEGTGNDNVLRYLDMAGGVDPDRGSFLDIQVKRGATVRYNVDLYRFLLNGDLPSTPLTDGDVIFVGQRKNTVMVGGLAASARRFEFNGTTTLAQIAAAARPDATSTNVRVTRGSGTVQHVEYYPLSKTPDVTLMNGDLVEFTADKRPGTITVRVEGEHLGPQEYVVPYGTKLGDLLGRVEMTSNSLPESTQLFRQSVKDRQAKMLDTSLTQLQNSVLTARSGTNEESQLRQREAALVLQWVDRARHIDPSGQAVIGHGEERSALLLENGDRLRIPTRNDLVLIGGEVLFPNSFVFKPGANVQRYIQQAGGYTQNADSSRVIIAHLDGTFVDARQDDTVMPGDQIMILPKVDFKTMQFAKDVFSILYQIAIAAKVAIGL
ncbi:polysaccharide export protein, polysialic acid transport protein kpsD precursor (plasmid) [Cupriavidus metallidurans CH34]|uniref:Polysaccharide export protein, polysialic acid transport protein kpsD n=2 Tax=Cupriavidus metallidurans TaxID=119219 RepID=Q1LB88_CUPMC|nr:polysaccharide export protein, polysialic acid transport protein kpsD precursor [Cupriavidus metallidurans CH34]